MAQKNYALQYTGLIAFGVVAGSVKKIIKYLQKKNTSQTCKYSKKSTGTVKSTIKPTRPAYLLKNTVPPDIFTNGIEA